MSLLENIFTLKFDKNIWDNLGSIIINHVYRCICRRMRLTVRVPYCTSSHAYYLTNCDLLLNVFVFPGTALETRHFIASLLVLENGFLNFPLKCLIFKMFVLFTYGRQNLEEYIAWYPSCDFVSHGAFSPIRAQKNQWVGYYECIHCLLENSNQPSIFFIEWNQHCVYRWICQIFQRPVCIRFVLNLLL